MKYLRIRLLDGVMPVMDFDGLCDPFLIADTGFMKWQSPVIKETLTPNWRTEAIIACYHLENIEVCTDHWDAYWTYGGRRFGTSNKFEFISNCQEPLGIHSGTLFACCMSSTDLTVL